MNSLPILYVDSIKYLWFVCTSNACDDADILKQVRLLHCRSNRLISAASKYCLNYIGISARYSTVLISGHPKNWDKDEISYTFPKTRVAFSNVYRKILGMSRRGRASGMFVSNDILGFKFFSERHFIH